MSESIANASVYLLLGANAGGQKERIDTIRNTLLQNNTVDYQTHYASEFAVNDLVALCRTDNLFTDHSLIVYRNVDALSGKNAHALLNSYCAHPAAHNTLIMTTTKNALTYGWVKHIPKKNRIICWQPFDSEIENRIRDVFAHHAVRATPAVITEIALMVERDSQMATLISRQLAHYCGAEKSITHETVSQFLTNSRTETVFHLVDALLARNSVLSLAIAYRLLDRGESGVLMTLFITRTLHKLWRFQQLLQHNSTQDAAFKTVGIFWKQQQQLFLAAVRAFKIQELSYIIDVVQQITYEIRQISEKLIDTLITRLIVCVCEAPVAPLAPEHPTSLLR